MYTQQHTRLRLKSELVLPKKGLRIAHLNICSLLHKVQEVSTLLSNNNLNIMAISETHLDATVNDSEVAVPGYCIFRHDRNKYGGGVAIYVQSHIPCKVRHDLMVYSIEILWLQIHLPHIKPIIVGCCYRLYNTLTTSVKCF